MKIVMGAKNEKKGGNKAVAAAVCIVIAIAAGAGGYYIGSASQSNSMMNALPKPLGTAGPETAAGDVTETEEPAAAEEDTYIGKTNVSAAAEGTWTTVDSCNYDITGDGMNNAITLYTSAESDDKGIMWDDSQNWILEISDGANGYYTLLNERVSGGAVYYDVNEMESGDRSVTVYVTSGAGTDITEYVFGGAGFTEKQVYSAGVINKVHSSIPWYR